MPGQPVILEGSYWEELIAKLGRLTGCEDPRLLIREALRDQIALAERAGNGQKIFVGPNRLGAEEFASAALTRASCLGEAGRRLRGE